MSLTDSWPVRAVALASFGYSAAITVAPRVLAKPCGLLDQDGQVPPATAGLIRATGMRDATLAVLLALAPAGGRMRRMTIARVICDGSDACWFAQLAPPGQRLKIGGVAATWALLQVAVELAANHGRD